MYDLPFHLKDREYRFPRFGRNAMGPSNSFRGVCSLITLPAVGGVRVAKGWRLGGALDYREEKAHANY